MTSHWIRAAGLVLMLSGNLPAGAQQPPAPAASAPLPPIDAAEFYKPPGIERTRLSPSGRWLAFAAGVGNGRIGLAVFDLQAWKLLAMVANYNNADIGDFEWAGDERLVYSIRDQQLGGGDQRWWPGLFSVERDGSEPRQLVKVDQAFVVSQRSVGREPLEFNHQLLHVPDDGSDDVIVGEWQRDGSREFIGLIAKRLNVRSGRATSLSSGAPPYVWHYLFDSKGEPRVAVTRRQGRETVHWRVPGETAWKVLSEHAAEKAPFKPRSVGADGSLFVSVARGANGEEVLLRFDFATGKPASDPLVRTPGFDFDGGIVSETKGSRALGVRVVTDAETTVWFDPAMTAFQKKVDELLPGTVNRVNCRRCGQSDMTAIVSAWSDRDPGQLWFYSAIVDQWRKVGDRRPGIDPRRMGLTDFERIRARDGLQLPLWITRPAGAAAGPRPAVVLVHGGPWVRGRSWEWNADAQFLASRGYVVLEPEFRGSTGYGAALYRAGLRQWGRAMQDDLADALAWAVGKKIVDPQRVCIAGASYGGYATLMGLVRHPELYRCGAAWVAVTDPRLMFNWRADYDVIGEHREHTLLERIGDPVADAAMLASVAPVEHADRIRAPLLLAFGGGDRRVPLVHGERMRKALTAAGRPPEWLLYPDEGHGWFKVENKIDFARRLDAFLARHLQ